MAHKAHSAITAWLSSANETATLGPSDAASILPHLRNDSTDMYYSAALSLLQALAGAGDGHFSWAIVKLYYASFYAVRCQLAANNVALFYKGSKPWSLEVAVGRGPAKENGNTHKIVWYMLRKRFPNNVLLGTIEGDPAHIWLTRLREEANYKAPRFIEPLVPTCLSRLGELGPAEALLRYIHDDSMSYVFDPDHAVVAFPLECIRRASNLLSNVGIYTDASDEAQMQLCATKFGSDLPTPMFGK